MFDWLRYRYRQFKLRKQIQQELKNRPGNPWQNWMDAQQQNKPQEEIDALWRKIETIAERNHDRLVLLETDYLTSVVPKYLLTVPPLSYINPGKEWKLSQHALQYYLTPEAMRELRLAIRAARRERLELARSWLTSITGLIGALIGLIAVMLGRH